MGNISESIHEITYWRHSEK